MRKLANPPSILALLAVGAILPFGCTSVLGDFEVGGANADASTSDSSANHDGTTTDGTTADSPSDGGTTDASDSAVSCLPLDGGAPGTLDVSFATGVKMLGSFSPNAAAVDAQGRIYVAGTSADCGFAAAAVVHRFNVDGTHDTTFGNAANGVCIHYDNVDSAYAIAVDNNGSVVVGGLAYGTRLHATVTRLTTSGALDVTFNGGGKVDLDPSSTNPNGFAAVQGIAIGPNKIVLTGSTEAIRPGVGTRHTGYIIRLNRDGSVDQAFAAGLYKDTSVVGYYGVGIEPNGNVVAVGATNSTPRQLVVRRLTVLGAPDNTFGDAGAYLASAPIADGGTGPTEARALMLSGARYLVGGPMAAGGSGDYASGPAGVMAVTNGGTLDIAWSANGVRKVLPLFFNIGYQLTAFAPECDGKILFGARYDDPTADASVNQDLGLCRFTANGALDTTFGTNGIAHFAQAGNEITVAVAQDPSSGKIVVVGANQAGNPVLARFNP